MAIERGSGDTRSAAGLIGLAMAQRPHLGRLGWFGAGLYAYSYVFFTGTVIYALFDGTNDFDTLNDDLAPWMVLHGALMVVAGLSFGIGVIRAGVFPRWTAVALIAGVILVSVSQDMPDGVQLVAAGIRDLGFAGMGAAVLISLREQPAPASPFRTVGDKT